jgi:hypothetical protein
MGIVLRIFSKLGNLPTTLGRFNGSRRGKTIAIEGKYQIAWKAIVM